MSRGVRILARPEVAAGFALTGLPVTAVGDAVGAADCYRDWLDDATVGVVLMQQELHDHLPADLHVRQARQPLPMTVPFPGPVREGPAAAERYIVELLRQVIGYRVRLR